MLKKINKNDDGLEFLEGKTAAFKLLNGAAVNNNIVSDDEVIELIKGRSEEWLNGWRAGLEEVSELFIDGLDKKL